MPLYNRLKSSLPVQTAIKHIEISSGGYSFDKMGIGRILPIVLNPKPLQLSFKDEVYRFFRRDLIKKREEDTRECLLPAISSILEQGYNCTLQNAEILDDLFSSNYPNLVNNRIFFGSEGEFLHSLANSSITGIKRYLPKETRKEIDRILSGEKDIRNLTKNPIKLVYFGINSLEEIISGDTSKLPFASLSFRIKTFESIALKMLERYRRIYFPSEKELFQMSHNRKTKIDSNELIDFYETWIEYTLALNADIFDSIIGTQPIDFQVSYLASKNIDEPNLRPFGGNLNESFSDTIPTDIVGGAINLKNNNSKEKLSGIIDHKLGERFTHLCHKRENNKNSGSDCKDGSMTWGISSSRSAQFAELRVKTNLELMIAEFGGNNIVSHYIYRQKQIKLLKEALKKSEKMFEIAENCEKLFNFKLRDINL